MHESEVVDLLQLQDRNSRCFVQYFFHFLGRHVHRKIAHEKCADLKLKFLIVEKRCKELFVCLGKM